MNRQSLEARGFAGFAPPDELLKGRLVEVPDMPGVYVVFRTTDQPPSFMTTSRGGHFKRKDPSVTVHLLQERWVDGTDIVYIGKADRLRRRIDQLCRFGAGEPVGHWGGRYLWQLEQCNEFVVAWLPSANPLGLERELINEFKETFGRFPFANIQGPNKAGLPKTRTPDKGVGAITLHEELADILVERGNMWTSTKDLSDKVNRRGRYPKRDGSPVTAFQVHGRTRKYPKLFERQGSSVRLTANEFDDRRRLTEK